jgi:hypothetical protein
MSNCTQREINITFVNIFHSSFIVCLYMFCRWRTDVISLTGLTAPYACPKPGPRLNTEYNVLNIFLSFIFIFRILRCPFPYLWHSFYNDVKICFDVTFHVNFQINTISYVVNFINKTLIYHITKQQVCETISII